MDARLETLYRMQPLSTAETDTLFTEVFAGSMSEPELASLLTALKMKGETLDEIRGAAAAMLRAARPFPKSAFEVGEIVGTGGDGAGTINVSTMTALAAASAGLRIAKHGNRGVSSPSGASSPSPASAPPPSSSASHARPASSSWLRPQSGRRRLARREKTRLRRNDGLRHHTGRRCDQGRARGLFRSRRRAREALTQSGHTRRTRGPLE